MHDPSSLATRIRALLDPAGHPQADLLIDILCGPTGMSSAGYPFISLEPFRQFVDHVPHLFSEGRATLSWVSALVDTLERRFDFEPEERASVDRAARVLRTMIFTAGVTAPPDLWLLRQVAGAHHRLGLIEALGSDGPCTPEACAGRLGLDARQLGIDWSFLYVRGYLSKSAQGYGRAADPRVARVLPALSPLPDDVRGSLVPTVLAGFSGEAPDAGLGWWMALPDDAPTGSWVASARQIELGYRLVPILLGLRVLGVSPTLKRGERLEAAVPVLPAAFQGVLDEAGLLNGGAVTALGQRVFQRAPGPAGIIAAYHPYLRQIEHLLQGTTIQGGVSRGENVAASQDANRASFEAANNALDAFRADHGFQYSVYIEHAVGQGEATRQRFERDGDEGIHYFGADLEDAAIDEAVKQQQKGVLPASMTFIRQADIGEPARVVDALRARGLAEHQAVMVVGNGFHEIRNQTNERMIAVFRGYREAGILIIFTEESALSDDDVVQTAWNTYHAGFRYVHEMSGQGLRPIWEKDGERWGWRRCAAEAGYVVLDAYSHRSRTIYPNKREDRDNPSISVTYFCVPGELARALGLGVA